MKLRLNLATSPQANNRPFLAGAVLVGVLALIALGLLSYSAYNSWVASRDLRAEMAGWESKIRADQVRHEELQSYFREPHAQSVIDRSAFLNSLIAERSFPWTKILTDIGDILPPGVRVISISPQLDNGRAQVTLQVGAASEESKLQFLEAIEKSNVFSDLVVKSEHNPTELSSPDRVVLDLTVWYTTTPPAAAAPSESEAPSEAKAPSPESKLPPPSEAKVPPPAAKPPSSRATVPPPSEASKATVPPPSKASVIYGFGVIRDVNLAESDGHAEVNITGSSPLTYHKMRLPNPDRLVLDFASTHLTAAQNHHITSNLDPVRDIRMAQFTPEITRVVIDLLEPAPYQIKTDGNNVIVEFAPKVSGR